MPFGIFGFGRRTKPLVLHVDDSRTIIMVVKSMLREIGCDTLEALTGFEAIEIAEKEKPDLILLDSIMPEMDGCQTCSALKTNPKTKDIPILMVTGQDVVKEVDKAIEAGAEGYILKPVNVERLRSRLKSFIQIPDTS